MASFFHSGKGGSNFTEPGSKTPLPNVHKAKSAAKTSPSAVATSTPLSSYLIVDIVLFSNILSAKLESKSLRVGYQQVLSSRGHVSQ